MTVHVRGRQCQVNCIDLLPQLPVDSLARSCSLSCKPILLFRRARLILTRAAKALKP